MNYLEKCFKRDPSVVSRMIADEVILSPFGINMKDLEDTYKCRVKIANICCSIESSNIEFLETIRDRYAGFIVVDEDPTLRIVVHIQDDLVRSDFDAKESNVDVYTHDDKFIIKRADFLGFINPQTLECEVTHCLNSYSFEAFLRIVYSLIIIKENGFLLHASSVIKDGDGFVFSGKSGVGKSTIAEISSSCGCIILSDEISIIKKVNGEYYVFGTPFWGELEKDNENVRAQINGLYLIKQDRKVSVKELQPTQAIKGLMPNVLYFAKEPKLTEELFNICYDFIMTIPLSELCFLPDNSFWRIIHDNK